MAALVYLTDELVGLNNDSDWRIQLIRDASTDLADHIIPIVWSKQNEENMAKKNVEIEPLFELLEAENEELPTFLLLNENFVAKYVGPVDSAE